MRPCQDNLSLFTDDELELFRRDQAHDQVVPFVCGECENIGGYYAVRFQEIACPHCGGSAHPITLYAPPGEALDR